MVGEDEGEAALEADEGAAAGAAEVGAGIAVIEAAEENAAGSRAFPIKNKALHPGARHTRAPLFFVPPFRYLFCPQVLRALALLHI